MLRHETSKGVVGLSYDAPVTPNTTKAVHARKYSALAELLPYAHRMGCGAVPGPPLRVPWVVSGSTVSLSYLSVLQRLYCARITPTLLASFTARVLRFRECPLREPVIQVSVFVVNLKGRPFMGGLFENRPLLYSLAATFALTFMSASETIPRVSFW